MNFTDFDLDERILEGLKALQYKETTPIQKEGIPIALEGRDLVGLAQTGTGKTGAFVIPILQDILKKRDTDESPPHALILTPTRELAKQVDEMIFAMGYHTGVSSATIIGGEDFGEQAKHIRQGVDVLVATPGRLLDILNVLNFELSSIHTLVLDEADRMLDMGFYPDVSKIIRKMPEDRQTMLFSATMSSQIEKLSQQFMRQPEKIEFSVSKPVDTVEQHAYFVENNEKLDLVEKIFDRNEWESAIVFAATKKWTEKLHQKLQKRGIDSVSIHGDRSQEERNESLHKFKSGQNPVIVATDVLSRGIDIDDVSMIINYDLPHNSDDYIHRIGRTGRHKNTGIAITFVTGKEKGKYKGIKNEVGLEIKEYSASEIMREKEDKKKDKKQSSSDDEKSNNRRSSDNAVNKKDRSKKDQDTGESKADRPGRSENKKRSKGSARSSSEKSPTSNRQKRSGNASDKQSAQASNRSKKSEGGKKSRSSKSSRSRKKSDSGNNRKDSKSKHDQSSSSSSSSKRSSKSKSDTRSRNRKSGGRKKSADSSNGRDRMVVQRIEKAIQRNKNTRKPAKGFWGVIKSLIPKIKQD